jgi:hypothetical protein
MTYFNIQKAKEELVVFLRNSDILSIAQRGVTTVASEAFSGTGSAQTITLANNTVRNIRSVTVTSVSKRPYFDYTPTYGTTCTITGTFTAGTNNIIVSYDYSVFSLTTKFEGIFPDYPEIKYLVDDVPRIGFDIMATRTNVIGIGNTNWLSDATVQICAYDKNLKNIDGYLNTIRSVIKTNQKNFYHFPIVFISNSGPPIVVEHLNKKVFQKNIDILMRFAFES